MEKTDISNFSKTKILGMIFFTTFTVSASGSNGYAILAGLKKEFVEKYGWIEEDEMMNMASLAQSAPGPMAISASVIVGHHLAGPLGSIVAVTGTSLPPFLIMTLVYYFYRFIVGNHYVETFLKAMRASVAALIISITIDTAMNIIKKKNLLYIFMSVISFILLKFIKVPTVIILILCAAAGIIYAVKFSKEAK